MLRTGGLFTGSGILELVVESVFGANPAWFCEYEPPTESNPRPTQAASRLLAHRFPQVPNHGDVTTVDWATVEPVDILTMGFPCTDVSAAGKRAGLRPGTRSGLWAHGAYAIAQLRPRLVVIENVRGLLSSDADCDLEPCPWCVGDQPGRPLRALGAVLGDLASLGYDAEWAGLHASDVGACHPRFRVFVLAWPAAGNPDRIGEQRWSSPELEGETGSTPRPAPHPNGIGPVRTGRARGRGEGSADHGQFATHPESNGRGQGRAESAGIVGGSGVALGGNGAAPDTSSEGRSTRQGVGRPAEATVVGDDPPPVTDPHGDGVWQQPVTIPGCGGSAVAGLPGPPATDWGDYGPAIRRWERIIGRPAPAPTVTGQRGGQQLSPYFVEWMMGWPDGWATGVPGLSRNDMIRIMGNGIVPQQAVAAVHHLRTYLVDAAGAGL